MLDFSHNPKGDFARKTLIIAEAGVNHNKSVTLAKELVDVAKYCGADVVKFQLELPNKKTDYTLPWDEQLFIYEYCLKQKIPFSCTAFDAPTMEFLLKNTEMPFIKIASANWCIDESEKEMFALADKSGLPIILSSRNTEDLFRLKNFRGDASVSLLHCVGSYPTRTDESNLGRIPLLKEFGKMCGHTDQIIGLSDHSGNPLIPSLAVALGAEIVECHLTISKTMEGPDHKASLNPVEFQEMVNYVRMAEKAL